MRTISLAIALLLLLGTVARSADADQDGLLDGVAQATARASTAGAQVAVVEAGSTAIYVGALEALGYSVTLIPATSGLDVLDDYALVVLPVSHARPETYSTLDGLAADYHAYVQGGGSLWVAQPNPFGMPDDEAAITWVPYVLALHYAYVTADCPPVVIDAGHCVTAGMTAAQFSMPGDEVIAMGSEWRILVAGAATGRPGVMVAEYGAGKILVELGLPGANVVCDVPNEVLARYATCLLASTSPVDVVSFGRIKARHRGDSASTGP